jgi:hypothetical protein
MRIHGFVLRASLTLITLLVAGTGGGWKWAPL